MKLLPPGLMGFADNEATRKKLRYAGVSAASVPIGQGLLQVLGLWLNSYAAASLLTAAIVIVPSFFVNKYFVWKHKANEHLGQQMLAFWVAMMLAFSLGTLLAYIIDHVAADQSTLVRGTAVFCAQLLAFGTVWVGRYILLDRWLFKLPADPPDAIIITEA